MHPDMIRIIEECLQSKISANRRANYVKELRRFLRKFLEAFQGVALSTITPSLIDGWITSSFSHPSTRATAMNRLSALFSFARRRGYIESNPVERLDRVRIEQRPPRILSPEEAEGLVAAARLVAPEMLPSLFLGLYAGIRPAELDRLDWSAVDLKRGLVRIDAAASKVRRRRIVELHAKALVAMAPLHRDAGPIVPRQKRRRRRRIETALGWEYWPHDLLRHTAASFLLALHKDSGKVAMMLGNSPGVLLRHYHELVSPEDCAKFWNLTADQPNSSWPPA